MDPNAESRDTMKRKEYSRRLEFEHELINRRVTWLLTSQSILFAAYGVVMQHSNQQGAAQLLKSMATIGPLICGSVLLGIVAAFLAKYRAWRRFKGDGHEGEPFGVETWITYLGFAPEIALPYMFAIAWTILLDASLWFWLTVIALGLTIVGLVCSYVLLVTESRKQNEKTSTPESPA
jgi:hypothetical protein